MDREKEIEEMAVDINDCITEFVTDVGDVYIDDETTAQKMFDKGYRKQEWISVDERLPNKKINCIVYYKHAYCNNDDYWAIDVSFFDGKEFRIDWAYKVTHWMLLPEPPKMTGGE